MKKMCSQKQGLSQFDGFTLIEISIALIFFGLLVGAAVTGLKAVEGAERTQVTNERLSNIQDAISIYIQRNGFAPCVAGRTHAVNTAEYGREQLNAGVRDCTVAPNPAGAPEVAEFYRVDQFGTNVQIGAVPARSLNLPDDHMYDGWGNQFTYAVTESMTIDPAGYQANDGVIPVQNSDATTPVLATDEGMYVVVSHGRDGRGAFARNGAQFQPCNAATRDGDNCDPHTTDDVLFRTNETRFNQTPGNLNASFFSQANNAERFDDFVVFDNKETVFLSVVKDYTFDEMNCRGNSGMAMNDPNMHGGVPVTDENPFGFNCSTLSFTALNEPPHIPASDPPATKTRDWGISMHGAGWDASRNYSSGGCNTSTGGTDWYGAFCNTADVANIRVWGRPLFTSSVRTSNTNGKVIVRATIPITYDNSISSWVPDPALMPGTPPAAYADRIYPAGAAGMLNLKSLSDPDYPSGQVGDCWNSYWELAVHGAVYVIIDGVLDPDPIVIGDVINPLSMHSGCGASDEFGDTFGGTGSLVGEFQIGEGQDYQVQIYIYTVQENLKNVAAWAGTVRLKDTQATGYVEFMELGAF